MATTFDFAPSALAPFSFQPTLDGQIYTVIVTWNLFAQRWYINVYNLSGTLIVATALIGSPLGIAIAAVSWALGTVTITTQAPHGYPPGATIDLTVSAMAPDAYNGLISALVTGPDTFTYALADFPGAATALGVVAYNINLVASYFTTSSLVFRQANQQFEVSP